MAQQAKDIYSGIKKIFPSSRRSSGSFSFSGRSSSSASGPVGGGGPPSLFGPDGGELSAAAAADADAHKRSGERRKKERRPSFSFSSWGKDKHRSSSSASSTSASTSAAPADGRGHRPDPADAVVMTLPYGAQAATPKGYVSPSSLTAQLSDAQNRDPNARGSLYNEPSAAVTSAKASAAGPPRSAAHSASPYSAHKQPTHGFSSSSLAPPKLGGRSVSVDLTPRGASGRLDDRVAAAGAGAGLLQYSSGPASGSGVRGSRRSRNSASAASGSSVRSFSSSVGELAAPTVLEHEPLRAPAASARRDSLSVYRHSLSAASKGPPATTAPASVGSAGRASLGSLPAPASTVLTPERPKKKKERRTSLSFTSSRKKAAEAEAAAAAAMSAASRSSGAGRVRLPSADLTTSSSSSSSATLKPTLKPSTTATPGKKKERWDSDSDDDYEDSKRPTRGLDRRSQSMDFMEQAPTHLISKIWRKLPIQARLIGGRGSGGIDLDLQKDRNSFSRSSSAKAQLREQQQQGGASSSSPGRRPPSPVPDESNVFGDKRIRFALALRVFEPRDDRRSLESYDEVLVRVCRFAAHDQRRTATKVQEFLERSMAFLHGTRTKHGNVASISNEEIRMWRRLALHDWASEEPAALTAADRKKDKRSSSSVSTAGSDDSDEPSAGASRHRPPPIETMSEQQEDEPEDVVVDEEEEEEEELKLPRRLNLSPLREVVNCCVGFGERLFSTDEIDDLVRLEFLVEEDGWI